MRGRPAGEAAPARQPRAPLLRPLVQKRRVQPPPLPRPPAARVRFLVSRVNVFLVVNVTMLVFFFFFFFLYFFLSYSTP